MAPASGIRGLALATGVVTVIVVSAYYLGRAISPIGLPAVVPPIAATQAPSPRPSVEAAGVPVPAPALAQPVNRLNPITGPNRPPLPVEGSGPFGSRVTSGTPEVALTFDDGPDPDWTPQVLALLRQYHVKATFCMIGQNVVSFPDLVQAIADDGHTLCNHSWEHNVGLALLSPDAIRADLSRTNDAIHDAAPGYKVSYFRQPGGAWSQTVVNVAKELGMSSLHWTVDPQDWTKPGAGSIASYVTAGTTAGSIVLMHDGGGDRRGTVGALRTILPNLTRRFQLASLPPGVDPPKLHGRELPVHEGQI